MNTDLSIENDYNNAGIYSNINFKINSNTIASIQNLDPTGTTKCLNMQNNWITNVADLYVNDTASIINISCKHQFFEYISSKFIMY